MLSEAAMCRYCFSVKVSMPETVGKPLAVHTLRRCWSVTAARLRRNGALRASEVVGALGPD